ncbi:hypothetical protein [Pseudaminobacter sp. NGMCC 1.201702]|uniref:hypothetical protein n=1 Tax=Pseudaminobacter sp. NGMCC 1.201702 TaxID=3391825 RepID=UPI0039F0C623
MALANSTIAASYADKPAVLIAYVAAMRSYGAAAEREGVTSLADTLVARDRPPSIPWTWTAANGDSVRRVEEGVFRLSTGDYLDNWFTEVECRMDEWPLFLCSDGKERRMSAPDLGTMIFQGIEYTRPLPEEQLVDEDSGAQGPP